MVKRGGYWVVIGWSLGGHWVIIGWSLGGHWVPEGGHWVVAGAKDGIGKPSGGHHGSVGERRERAVPL